MKTFTLLFLSTLFFFGCNSVPQSAQAAEPKLVVGKNLKALSFNDQFGTPHKIEATTKSVIFAFSKDNGHLCNEFFSEQNPTYLANKNAIFIADISQVPSLIRSLFVEPGLKDLTHRVLLIEDDATSAKYRTEANAESIVVAKLSNGIIQSITLIHTKNELAKAL